MVSPTDVQERIRALEAVDAVQGVTDLGSDRIQREPRIWRDPIRSGVAYFRIPDQRMPRGRIALLQNGQNAMERVMYRGQVMLNRYGDYRGAGHPADWQHTDPYLAIIQRGGGFEFDAAQIIDLQWHYRPDIAATRSHRLIWDEIDRLIRQGASEDDAVLEVVPQLAGVDRTIQTCEACGPDRRFRDAESVRMHRSIMHPSDVQSVGTREAIAQALQAGGGSMERLIEQVMTQNALLTEMLNASQNGGARRGGRPSKSPTDDSE